MNITLNQPFAKTGNVDAFDVLQLKKSLNRLGYYQPLESAGITDSADTAIFDALKEFQKDQGLPATGEARPNDETIRALNRAISTPPSGYYMWRCVEDGKARPEHAQFNRTVRMWSDAPDPGDDFNCRCWAAPLAPSRYEGGSDEINPAIAPWEILSAGHILKGAATRTIVSTASRLRLTYKMYEAKARDVEWIRKAPREQLQKKFKHAQDFGIQGNQNKESLLAYQKALEAHVRSPDTKIIKGTYLRQPVAHYYNSKTGINVMRTETGHFSSAWKLSDDQIKFLTNGGHIGGGK